MPFPKTVDELEAAGYEKAGEARCRDVSCRAPIDWYKTPKGKRIPMDRGTADPHWGTCAASESFRH